MIDRRADNEPALFGDLSRFTATDILQFLGFLGLTGTIEFTRKNQDQEERIHFRVHKGRLIEARASGPHLRLGELLVRRYDVAMEAVLDHLQHQNRVRQAQEPARRIGELLIEAGHLKPESLKKALDEAATRVAFRVLTWKEGRFAYWPSQADAPPGVTASVGLEDLVIERWHASDITS